MINYADKIEKSQLNNGTLLQWLGHSENLSVVHWNIPDGNEVALHHHPQEQFGYVISGGFTVDIGDETYTLKAGDSYFIPSNVPHRFVAIGDTEAIDVFSPIRDVRTHYS